MLRRPTTPDRQLAAAAAGEAQGAAGSHESAVAAMMTITWVYALLALVLAANAVVAFEAIFKPEEPRGPR